MKIKKIKYLIPITCLTVALVTATIFVDHVSKISDTSMFAILRPF